MSKNGKSKQPPTGGEEEPKKRNKGWWPEGTSGNYKGRPPKEPKPVKSLADMIGEQLAEEIEVKTADGKTRMMSKVEILVTKLVNQTMTAPLKDILATLDKIEKLGGLEAMLSVIEEYNEQFEEFHFTEKEIKYIDQLSRELGDVGLEDDDDIDDSNIDGTTPIEDECDDDDGAGFDDEFYYGMVGAGPGTGSATGEDDPV